MDGAKSRNEKLIKLQSEVCAIQDHIQETINIFSSKGDELRESSRRYFDFLEVLKSRSSVLNEYTEDILARERSFSNDKQTYEKLLAKRIREIKRDETNLNRQLTTYREQLKLLCSKKTQISKVLASITQTIAEFSNQEQNLDRLFRKADRITKQAHHIEYTSPESLSANDMNHLHKLASFASKDLILTQERIDQSVRRKNSLMEEHKLTQEKIEILESMRNTQRKILGQQNSIRKAEKYQIALRTEISEKKKLFETITKECQNVMQKVATHRDLECEAFVDYRRSSARGKMISETRELVKRQIGECMQLIKSVNEDTDSKRLEADQMLRELEYLQTDLEDCDTESQLLIAEVTAKTKEADIMNNTEIEADETIDFLTGELNRLNKEKRQAIIEEEALKLEYESLKHESYAYDLSVQTAKQAVLKKTNLLELEFQDLNREIADLRELIRNRSLLATVRKEEQNLCEKDLMKHENVVKECRELFGSDFSSNESTLQSSLKIRSYSREITNRGIRKQISELEQSVNDMRKVVGSRRDSCSAKRTVYTSSVIDGYYSLSGTPTLKRSRRLPQIQNALEDKIHVLTLVNQILDGVAASLGNQIEKWHEGTPNLNDWPVLLNRLQQQADDLVTWKQLFSPSSTETPVSETFSSLF